MTDSRKLIAFALILVSFLCIIGLSGCIDAKKVSKIQMIIDADTANEVDDLFALVRAVEEPRFELLGITSAQFHTSPLASTQSAMESQKINEDLLRMLDRENIPAILGSNTPLASGNIPASSAASEFIVAQANKMHAEGKLHLVILGSCTNVASAILQDTSIVSKLEVHYLGFWHDPENNTYNKKEFNSGNDTLAVEYLLNIKDLAFNVMSATTSQNLVFEKKVVEEQLKSTGDLGTYLLNRWDTYERWWTKEDPQKERWIMWDVAIIEALARPELAIKETFTTPEENTKRYIKIYTSIEDEEMKRDYWGALSSLIKSEN